MIYLIINYSLFTFIYINTETIYGDSDIKEVAKRKANIAMPLIARSLKERVVYNKKMRRP